MPNFGFGEERAVGRVISISNYKISVLLDPDTRSQVRAYPHNIAIITQIGGYLLFPVAPSVFAVGIIVGASEDEALEPDSHGVMTLQLTRSRRVVRLNLLGQLKLGDPFVSGVSVYPTLDTPALLPTEEELTSILRFEPHPSEKANDRPIAIGLSPIYGQQPVMASYNDLLARPLGIVGNTGSGKSCSVARIIQEALMGPAEHGEPSKAKFIILDINGEYAKAFQIDQGGAKQLNAVYINGQRFYLPLWAFNLSELLAFFEASPASQAPVLERVVTELRENSIDEAPGRALRRIVRRTDACKGYLDTAFLYMETPTNPYCGEKLKMILDHLNSTLGEIREHPPYPGFNLPDSVSITQFDRPQRKPITEHHIPPEVVTNFTPIFEAMRQGLDEVRSAAFTTGGLKVVTADSPIQFDCRLLMSDEFFISATSEFRGQGRMQEYLSTLRLRIHRQISDKRWSAFTGGEIGDIEGLVGAILRDDSSVSVVDCSMLAHDVLPCFCSIFGRILLDLRTRSAPEKRTHQPFVLVLEEAHNYLRPARQDEPWGVKLARDAFERISKEGRKFGLSLVIASQRPSDVSATVLSQCANFLIHRIQNPEDIDYFKKILPLGSRDLLDQLPILAPGEGLLMGSAVNVPTRLKVRKPDPSPESETSRPWLAWQQDQPNFDTKSAVARWIADTTDSAKELPADASLTAAVNTDYTQLTDDDVPF